LKHDKRAVAESAAGPSRLGSTRPAVAHPPSAKVPEGNQSWLQSLNSKSKWPRKMDRSNDRPEFGFGGKYYWAPNFCSLLHTEQLHGSNLMSLPLQDAARTHRPEVAFFIQSSPCYSPKMSKVACNFRAMAVGSLQGPEERSQDRNGWASLPLGHSLAPPPRSVLSVGSWFKLSRWQLIPVASSPKPLSTTKSMLAPGLRADSISHFIKIQQGDN
jgi:hypothetical protein